MFLLHFFGSVLLHTWNFLTDGILSMFDTTGKHPFNAEFGKETLIASRWNKGFVVSRHRKLTRRNSFEGLMVCGQTGSGKSVRIISKQLFELKNCSMVVNDPAREMHQITSGYLSKFFRLQTLNFTDSSISAGYNILSRIKKPNDIHKIAHILTAATIDKNASDPFWSLQTKALLVILIRLVLNQPPEYRNMANVLYILHHLSFDQEKVDGWIVRCNDPKLLLDYKSLVATPSRTLQNILASAKAALQLFEDPEIAKVTANDSVDFEMLRKRETVLFLHTSIADQKYVSILNSIFFEQLYGYILQKLPEKRELDLFIILDEASSLFIPMLSTAVANTRKHRVGNLISLQSANYLETMYRAEAKNITANLNTKLFLPGQTSMDTLKEIELLSGKVTHVDKNKTERIKPLITVEEIRQLSKNRSLVLSGNHPIIKGRTSPYFHSWFKYLPYSRISPIPLTGDIPDGPVQYIQ